MNSSILIMLNLLLNFVETLLFLFYAECVLERRLSNVRFTIMLALLFLEDVAIVNLANDITVVKLSAFIVIYAIWLTISFYSPFFKSIILSVIFTSFICSLDSLFMLGLTSIVGQSPATVRLLPYVYYIFCFSVKGFELLCVVLFRTGLRKIKQFQKITWKDWLRTAMFPVASLVIILLLLRIYQIAPNTEQEILFCTVFLILIDTMTIVLLNYIEKQQEAVQENLILRRSIKIEQDNISSWMDAYAGQRKQTHDFTNQLSVIQGLAEKEAPNGALYAYVSQLTQVNYTTGLFVKTGRPVVDVILNQKHAAASAKGIRLRVQLDDLSNYPLPDGPLVVVLANLIDNAIEATEKVREETRRSVLLKMQSGDLSSLLYIENPTAVPVKIVNYKTIINRQDSVERGFGIKNIEKILEEHNAIYAMWYSPEKEMFCFSAQIPN